MKILASTRLFPERTDSSNGLFNSLQLREVAKSAEITLLLPIPWMTWSRPTEYQNGGVRVIPIPYVYPPRILRGWHGHFYRMSIARKVQQLLHESSFDLIYGMFAFPDGWAIGSLAKKAKIPFVLKVHGSDIHQLRYDRCRSTLLAESLKRAKKIIAVSNDLAREVREVAPDAEVAVVRNGVDTKMFRPISKEEARGRLGLPADEKLILYVGRMERVKGGDRIPEIARYLKSSARWLLRGEGGLRRSIVRELGNQLARWEAFGSQESLVDWYNASDVILVPSRAEGIPNILLEALSCDRAVVASSVGGIPEVLRDGLAGRLVMSEQPEKFADAIDSVLASKPVRGAARELVSELSWESSGRELFKELEAMIP